MRCRDPLYRCAALIHQHLERQANSLADRLSQRLAYLQGHCQFVERYWQSSRRAAGRGWWLAAGRLQASLLSEVRRLQESATELLACQAKSDLHPVALSQLIEELQALEVEFGPIKFQPREGLITLDTDPLVLEGLRLGPFSIELAIARLAHHPDSGCFRCIALEPNCPEGSPSVTHPHVKDDVLCAGEATVPIGLALSQGRIYDAFMLVMGVLQTYNPASPYVCIEEWSGTICPDCGERTSGDELYYCEGCGRDTCESCSASCRVCDQSVCRSCLERDPVTGRDCCSDCRGTCPDCGRIVELDQAEAHSRLCPECLAQKQEESRPIQPEEPSHDSTTAQEEPPKAAEAA